MKKITVISILTIIIVALVVIALTACDNVVARTPNSFYQIEDGGIGSDTYYSVFVDGKTGVEYLYVCSGYKAGLTPRYNADGSLYVYNGGTEG